MKKIYEKPEAIVVVSNVEISILETSFGTGGVTEVGNDQEIPED